LGFQPAGQHVTCLIADDHPPLVDAASRALEDSGYTIVGRAYDGQSALDAIQQLRPDIAIVDLGLPRLAGLEVARRATFSTPATAIILYTGSDEPHRVGEGIAAGARGYVLKTAPVSELVRAVELVAGGGTYVDPTLARAFATPHALTRVAALTDREREVLRLLAEGGDYSGIGKRLFISPETVRVHARRAMRKLDAETRTQAVAIALRRGIIG
jgi:DNA-binding NarL/FixJ family response regulator